MGKIAIISDIHSNPAALRRVLEDARAEKCSEFICLGDVVGYGYDPNECIRILTEETTDFGWVCVLGNHDAALCNKLPIDWFSETAAAGILRQQKAITDENRLWLSTLSYTGKRSFDSGINVFYAHGSYVPEQSFYSGGDEMFPYMTHTGIVRKNILKMREEGKNNVLFVGHTHERDLYHVVGEFNDYAGFERCLSRPDDTETLETVDLLKGDTIINVGSVGYPRHEPFTSYVVFDPEVRVARFRKLKFHFREYVDSMKGMNIPIPFWMNRWYDKEKDRYYDDL